MTDSKLEQAFDELLNRGWNSGSLLSRENSTVCILGALALAHGMDEESLKTGGPICNPAYFGLNDAHRADIELLATAAPTPYPWAAEAEPYVTVYNFNDNGAKSEDGVKRLIKSAIEIRDN